MNREPSWDVEEPRALLLGQLAHYRAATLDKLAGLSSDQLHARVLPSGWSSLELLNHLVYMERRWLQWGFEAEPTPDAHGDTDENDQWRIADRPNRDGVELLSELADQLREVGQRTESVAGSSDLRTRARSGGRFGDRQPTLGWILLHVLQEYAGTSASSTPSASCWTERSANSGQPGQGWAASTRAASRGAAEFSLPARDPFSLAAMCSLTVTGA